MEIIQRGDILGFSIMGIKIKKSEQPAGQPSNPVLLLETPADLDAVLQCLLYTGSGPERVTISPSCLFSATHAPTSVALIFL